MPCPPTTHLLPHSQPPHPPASPPIPHPNRLPQHPVLLDVVRPHSGQVPAGARVEMSYAQWVHNRPSDRSSARRMCRVRRNHHGQTRTNGRATSTSALKRYTIPAARQATTARAGAGGDLLALALSCRRSSPAPPRRRQAAEPEQGQRPRRRHQPEAVERHVARVGGARFELGDELEGRRQGVGRDEGD